MKVILYKKCGWKKVYLIKLDGNYNVNSKEELTFCNNVSNMEFDLSTDKFYYLENEKGYKTEVVIISENTDEVAIVYNRKKKAYYISIIDTNNYYNKAISVTLTDEKNLFFRKDKSKIIDIIVPNNYSKDKKYGLLLMFDGQNLYDKTVSGNYTDKNDPYGSWQVDVSMSMLNKNTDLEYIVVGIEHTDMLRTNELLTAPTFGILRNKELLSEPERIGYIDHLNDFINETLLPYMLANYNIDLNNIGISGSSMGGLGCHYIGLKNLGKYKFILCYTPASALVVDSAWINFYNRLDFKNNLEKLPLFYFFQGINDDLEKILYQGNINLTKNMVNAGYPKELIKEYIEPNAMHNEVAWRYAFNYMIYHSFK